MAPLRIIFDQTKFESAAAHLDEIIIYFACKQYSHRQSGPFSSCQSLFLCYHPAAAFLPADLLRVFLRRQSLPPPPPPAFLIYYLSHTIRLCSLRLGLQELAKNRPVCLYMCLFVFLCLVLFN